MREDGVTKIRVTLTLDPDIVKKGKLRAAAERKSYSSYLEDLQLYDFELNEIGEGEPLTDKERRAKIDKFNKKAVKQSAKRAARKRSTSNK